MKRISDVITEKEIKNWCDNEVVSIEAGTGAGKSYLIKNTLYNVAKEENKKILMLIHREKVVTQFKQEIEEDNKQDIIDIKTYQSIESMLLNNITINMDKYKYVVCDEFHYFMSDSAFNTTTDMSYEFISKLDCVRIFMSATCKGMIEFLRCNIDVDVKSYSLPIKFKFIKKINFFNKDNTVEELVEKFIKKDKKAIVFIKSAERCYNLYKKFKDNSMFCCGKSSKFYKYVDEKKINDMLANEKFECNILFTTTCLDAGANIIDNDLTEIICDIDDISTMKQCIGRKRLQSSKDKITLYIKDINNNVLGGRLSKLEEKRKKATYLMNNSVDKYIENFNRDTNDMMIYDVVDENGNITKKVNKLMLAKALFDSIEIDDILKVGYKNYICNELQYTKTYGMIESDKKNSGVEKQLSKIYGEVMLTKEDKNKLIELLNVRKDGHLLKSLTILNSALEETKSEYRIKQFETSRMIDGKKKKFKSAWKLVK